MADALNKVIQSIGVPKELISDDARAKVARRFGEVLKEDRVKQ